MRSHCRRSRVFLLVALFAVLGCESTPSGPPHADISQAPSVTVAQVTTTRLADERERVGRVRAVEDVELRARVSGFLQERKFEEGGLVERGALLFVIERAPYEAEVKRAEAALARAHAALKKATFDLQRAQQLRQRNVVSQADLDDAIAAEAQARAEVLAAEAGLQQARLDLGYTEIHAPFAGRIGRAMFSPGDLLGPESGALATIVSINPIHVYWQVPERVILEVRRTNLTRQSKGQPSLQVTARLRLEDDSIYEHTGVWDFLDNRVEPTTGTQTARAVFPNPDGLLLPGQYVSVIVIVGEPRESLVIPQSAVQEDQAGRFVLVVDEQDQVDLRRVEMGDRRGVYWEVRQGLTEGERVIYQGVQKARPGTKVKAVEHQPDPPTDP